MSKKVAIFGGSFDPIHLGHVNVIKTICDQDNYDEIRVIPAARSPHKVETVLTAEFRLECLQAICKDYPVIVDTCELDRTGPSYTYETVLALKSQYNADVTVWIGDDQFESLEEWYKIDELIKECEFVVFNRSGRFDKEKAQLRCSKESLLYGLRVSFVELEMLQMSSTIVREALSKQVAVNGWLPRVILPILRKNEVLKGPIVYGISGRAGTGKTTYSRSFAESENAELIELDKIGHEALENTEIQDYLKVVYGDHIFSSDNVVCRKTLGQIVFSDPDKLRQLNDIVHPFIKKVVHKIIHNSHASKIVIEGALIEEIGLLDYCEHYWVLDTPDNIIHERASKNLVPILENQRTREAYLKNADKTIF